MAQPTTTPTLRSSGHEATITTYAPSAEELAANPNASSAQVIDYRGFRLTQHNTRKASTRIEGVTLQAREAYAQVAGGHQSDYHQIGTMDATPEQIMDQMDTIL